MTDEALIALLCEKAADPVSRIDAGTQPRLYPTADAHEVAETERALGFPLPPLLRRLYTEVANGGFGPAGGLIGVLHGHPDAENRVLAETHAQFVADGWPRTLLPVWDWGDACWSCVDAFSDDERIVTHDESGATETTFTLSSWLGAWCNGVNLFWQIFEAIDDTMLNPFTKQLMQIKRRGRAKRR